jgi:hypothetical protein
MRAFATVLLGMVSACRHATPETETCVRDVTDFYCTAHDCCGVCYFDEDGGVHVQPCGPRRQASGRLPPESLQAWLLPDDGGTEEPEASVAPHQAAATPTAARPTDDDAPPGAVLVVERCGNPRKPSECLRCYWRLPDGGIWLGGPLTSCL